MPAETPRLFTALLLAAMFLASGCSTYRVADDFIRMQEDGAIIVPVNVTEEGGLMIDVMIDGAGPYPFLIDTGATTSAIFEDARRRLGMPIVPGKQVEVRGIVGVAMRPVAALDTLSFGSIISANRDIVVLEQRRQIGTDKAWGLIGLDILHNHALAWFPEEQRLYFIPHERVPDYTGSGWIEINLYRDPYDSGLEELYFTDVDIDDRVIPGLLDLGSVFTLMNWPEMRSPELRRFRRQSRNEWQIQGAVDEFLPTAAVVYPNFTFGQYPFYRQTIIVHEFNSRNITGVADKPLFIAGTNMFLDREFLIDFSTSRFYLSRSSVDAPKNNITGTRIRTANPTSFNLKTYHWSD